MSMSTKDKGLVIGGAVLGLLMGGTAMGATGASSGDTGEFFKYSDVKTSYTLAAAGEEGGEEDKKCGEKDSKCGDKDSKCGEEDDKDGKDGKGCGEASCG